MEGVKHEYHEGPKAGETSTSRLRPSSSGFFLRRDFFTASFHFPSILSVAGWGPRWRVFLATLDMVD